MATKAKPEKELLDFHKSLLCNEINRLHVRISHFDDLSFQIKGWTTTAWSIFIASGAKEQAPAVILASLAAILSFWILAGFFKHHQRAT
jgi:hypothetical protein